MKTFNIWEYHKDCPLASSIEKEINSCDSAKRLYDKVKELYSGNVDEMRKFFIACLLYWSQTQYYDDRNRSAVLITREIIAEFKNLKSLQLPDSILKEAYGFTNHAHRYLQSVLFNIILEDLKETGYMSIHEWYKKQDFVIDRNIEKALPYEAWKRQRF